MNRLEKIDVCVRKFVTRNSWLEISIGCNIHTQSTVNHIHNLPGKCQSSFPLYSCYGHFSIQKRGNQFMLTFNYHTN